VWIASDAEAAEGQSTAPAEVAEESLFSVDTGIGPLVYRPGRGLQVGRTGLNIGGFATLELQKERGEDWQLSVDGINFLVLLQPIQPLRLFMELEVGNLFQVDLDDGEHESDPTANFQRLYAEYGLSDALNLRFGKFQTPVGEWNLVPAEPFTWTTTEPLELEAFDEHQTGPMLYGSFFPGDGTLSYWLYGQIQDFDSESDEDPADHSAGARLEYSSAGDAWSVGSSFLAATRDDRWGYVGGLDAVWRRGPFELSSEFLHTWGPLDNPVRWDVFVQGVVEVFPSWFLVGRYEHNAPSGGGADLDLGDVGVVWKPRPYVIFKATYRFADHRSEDVFEGFKSSLAVIF